MIRNKIQGAGGVGGGSVGGSLISHGTSLSVSPQAGDLIICHVGSWAGQTAYFNSGVVTVAHSISPYWSSRSHREDSLSGYRICNGTESGSLFTAGGGPYYVQYLSLYRFDSPVVSVTVQLSGTSLSGLGLNLALSSYTKPHIAFASSSAYRSNSASISASPDDYIGRPSRLFGIGLLNTEETNYTSLNWSASSVSFTPANSWGVITPNF